MKIISTGYRQLNDLLAGGFRRKSLTLLAGSLAQGKTTLALNIAAAVALGRKPETVLFFCNCECRHALAEGLIAAVSGVPLAIVRRAAFTGHKDLIWPASRISASPLYIVDGNWHPKRLTDIIGIATGEIIPGSGWKRMCAPALVIIDDLTGVVDNLWTSPWKFRSSREQYRSVLKGLKEFAVTQDVAVVGIAPVHHRHGKKQEPRPQDLEKLFGKEKFSDEQIFMRGVVEPSEHKVELHAAGRPGKAVLSHNPALALFSDALNGADSFGTLEG